ncbi:MAG: 30S ribosomal protein S17 [Nanoarchaeota archaeon]|nr:30S ribosomal protein S17 [Nanoarchaeota archaeon]MBU1632767.1 30S ribosomal protein S17 [Nanoarchaeota archaeon]MBU1876393.1 30S ribosomal protein S17 [Nanoarchaeota archaeon]
MNNKTKVRKEVFGISAPERAYDSQYYDKKCPFTGGLAVKKEFLKGKVVKRDTNKSATIEWHTPSYVKKYERYEVLRSRLRVHNPSCIDAQVGQTVLVARTRPLSKTKNHVIIKILDEEIKIPAESSKDQKDDLGKKESTKRSTKKSTEESDEESTEESITKSTDEESYLGDVENNESS